MRYLIQIMKLPCVYMLPNRRNGTIYIGVTSNLVQRIWQHKNDLVDGFTKRHHLHRLVWYESHSTMEAAITRERRLKRWYRCWKIDLIEQTNPSWRDLYPDII